MGIGGFLRKLVFGPKRKAEPVVIGSQNGPVPEQVLNTRPQSGFVPMPHTAHVQVPDDGAERLGSAMPQFRSDSDVHERLDESGKPYDWKQTSEYLPSDWAKQIFPKDLVGLPPVSIERRRGEAWLVDSVHGRLIAPGSLPLQALGIISFNVRGSQHYDAAIARAAPRPLDRLSAVHEPTNLHDKNTIAICAPGSSEPMGYVNKANAARIAERMRNGAKFSAVALRTPGYGAGGFSVVLTDDVTMAHLMRNIG